MDTFLTISQMAAATGLTEHTLRYYEKAGLVRSVPRAASGHRLYGANDQAWLHFLLRLKATGMPIAAMRAFADLRYAGEHTAGARRALLEAHLATVHARARE